MVLHPLAQVGIRVLMAVGVGCRQLVMDVLGDGQRGKAKQDGDQRERKTTTDGGEVSLIRHEPSLQRRKR